MLRDKRDYSKLAVCLSLVALGNGPGSPSASAASSLRGVSVQMHWIEIVHAYQERRNPNKSGEVEKDFKGQAKVYVSEKGRVFGETTVFNGGIGRRNGRQNGNGHHQQGPDDEAAEGEPGAAIFPWHWSAAGNMIAGTQVFSEGARQVQAVVERAGDGWQCSLRVILGKSNGELVRKGRFGLPEHVLSSEIREPGCEVSSGNVFQSETVSQ